MNPATDSNVQVTEDLLAEERSNPAQSARTAGVPPPSPAVR